MTPFPEFQRVNGPAIDCAPADPRTVQQFVGRLPQPLIDLWADAGWCGYGEGLLWIIDPNSIQDVLEDWFKNASEMAAFGRSAFGDLFLWLDNGVHYFDPHQGKVTMLTPEIANFMESALGDDDYLDSVVRRKLFRVAHSRLGPPAADECYAFEPALALGGSGEVETLRRVKLREHLGLLASIRFGR